MKSLRRVFGLTMAALLFFILLSQAGATPPMQSWEVTVLFTHDLHSQFLPKAAEEGGESGGYARLKTALDRERAEHPEALTVDAGDFSSSSLMRTLYTSQAAELRTMGALGYDAVTAGDRDFALGGEGFAQMLEAAARSGERLPAVVLSNYRPSQDNPARLDLQRAMAAGGLQDYILVERGGLRIGIFGLMGQDAAACASVSGFALGEPAFYAQRCVDALREQGAQFIICLSHGGTSERKKSSEDQQLAKSVEGIDLIVSGHTCTKLEEPIVEGDTYIVSAGADGEALGSITLFIGEDGSLYLKDYRLISIDGTLPQDPSMAALVENWKEQVETSYLSRYSLRYDQVLTHSPASLPRPEGSWESALGELAADACLWAAEALTGEGRGAPTVAVLAAGALGAGLPAGDLTVAQVFDVLPPELGGDGASNGSLVSFYLTGAELRDAMEADASAASRIPGGQLFFSGLSCTFNTHRIPFCRVLRGSLQEPRYRVGPDKQLFTQIDDGQLYRVVANRYTVQMLERMEEYSFGLLKLEPKDEEGEVLSELSQRTLTNQYSDPIEAWYALAAYLSTFEEEIPASYCQPDGRKTVSNSWSPLQLLRVTNGVSTAALAGLAVLTALVALAFRLLLRARRRRRYGGGLRRR